jgi:hypothetical protein
MLFPEIFTFRKPYFHYKKIWKPQPLGKCRPHAGAAASGARFYSRSRSQLARGFFVGKLKTSFGEKMAAVYKAADKTLISRFVRLQTIEYQARWRNWQAC